MYAACDDKLTNYVSVACVICGRSPISLYGDDRLEEVVSLSREEPHDVDTMSIVHAVTDVGFALEPVLPAASVLSMPTALNNYHEPRKSLVPATDAPEGSSGLRLPS